MFTKWQEAQKWELDWHINQQFNTFNEEKKQYEYAHLMGLDKYATNYYGIRGWNFGDKSVVDVGGGEVSMLLKSVAREKVVIDPLDYPLWVKMRYKEAGITFINDKAENAPYLGLPFDIGLMYNCLQHTEDPEKIISNLLEYAKTIHIFEWIDEPISDGHIQEITEEKMNEWLGGYGKVGMINNGPMVGKYYVGIFKGNHYEV